MKKTNKKGFTLIELLAVIVILAIIIIMAVASVGAVLNRMKKNAYVVEANTIVKALKNEIVTDTSILPTEEDEEDKIIPLSDIELQNGTKSPYGSAYDESSYVKIVKGSTIGVYAYSICIVDAKGNGIPETNIDNVTRNSVTTDVECSTEPEDVTTYYANGTAVYFNPVSGKKCDVASVVSTTGTKIGCMKWYAFLDSETGATTINLLLDHDTTGKTVVWKADHYNARGGPDATLLNQLKTDTDGWTGVVLRTDNYTLTIPGLAVNYTIDYSTSRARLISAFEVAEILNISSFNVSNNYINLDNTYSWLIDNIEYCNKYNNNCHADANSNGYFTSTVGTTYPDSYYYGYPYFVWVLRGRPESYFCNFTVTMAYNTMGIRPVITIPKYMIE